MRYVLLVALLLVGGLGCTQAAPSPESAQEAPATEQAPAQSTSATEETATSNNATPAPQPEARTELPPADPLAQEHLETYKADPTNIEALVAYANPNLRQIIEDLDGSPDEAEKLLVGFRQSLEGLETPSEDAQAVYMQIQDSLDSMADRLPVVRMSLEDIKAQVKADPNDASAVKMLASKLEMMTFKAMDEDLDKAEKILLGEVKFIEENAQKAEGNAAQIAYSQLAQTVNQMADQISRSKQYQAVVGKEMIELEADAWVNGDPLTQEDLHGKVVLLDFWAVWCGPCLMSFPHLAEWQKEYGDEGFQIVGLTRYYNFHWPEEAQAPEQSDHPVDSKDEQQMIERLMTQFELTHPSAILPNSSEASTYYAEMGLPHLVLIGRDGKVRRVEAGISSQLAEELKREIQDLLAEPAPEGAPAAKKPEAEKPETEKPEANLEPEMASEEEEKPAAESKPEAESEPAPASEAEMKKDASVDAEPEAPPMEQPAEPAAEDASEESAETEPAEEAEAAATP